MNDRVSALVVCGAVVLGSTASVGCAQVPPVEVEDDVGDTGGEEVTDERLALFPLIDGGHWEYELQSHAGEPSRTYSASMVRSDNETGKNDGALFRWRVSDDSFGRWSESLIRRDGSTAIVLSEIDGFYSASEKERRFGKSGVPIVDDGWMEREGDVFPYGFEEAVVSILDGTKLRGSHTERTFEVIDDYVPVRVPAGSLGCMHIRVAEVRDGVQRPTVDQWYAAGVGLVQEFRPDDGQVLKLVSFSIPEGYALP